MIFSVLAVAFLMEIDDRLMELSQDLGWKESLLYQNKVPQNSYTLLLNPSVLLTFWLGLQVEPALHALLQDENRLLLENRATSGKSLDVLVKLAKTWKLPSLWGQKVGKLWGLVLCSALFVFHQNMCIYFATSSNASLSLAVLNDVFNEV